MKRLVLGLAITAASSAVIAQTNALEEVIVTAQKRTENLQETPISIVALGAQELVQRDIRNSHDLMGNVVGIAGFESPGSRGTTGLNIRGMAAGAPANLSFDPAVAIYLDGVFMGKQVGSALDVAEMERVEILRGPQGTLYGRNSTAGAINFISRKPSGEFGVRATAGVGDYNYREGKINVDLDAFGTVGEGIGQIALSGGYQVRKRDGFQDNASAKGDDFNNLDREAWRLALKWDVSENLSIDYNYDRSELDETNALEQIVGFNDLAPGYSVLTALKQAVGAASYWSTLPGSDPKLTSRWIPSLKKTISAYEAAEAQGNSRANTGYADHPPITQSETDGHALTISWDVGDVSLKSITAYREMDSFVFGDLENVDSTLDAKGVGAYGDLVHLTLLQLYGFSSGYAFPFTEALWGGIDSIGAFHSKQDTVTEYEQFSQELQLVGETDALQYVVGLYYFEDEGEYHRDAIFAAPLSGAPHENYYPETEAWAIYGQATWSVTDQLSLTGGIRYTEETKEMTWDNEAVIGPLSFKPAVYGNEDEDFDNTSFNLTADYQYSDDLNAYLRFATGYRSGGYNGEVALNSFKEETVEQWEAGIKSDWLDGRLRVNAAVYTYTWEDIQTGTIKTDGGTATTLITNAGEAERWGSELEILYAPIDDMVVSMNWAHISGDFDEYPDICGTSSCIKGTDVAHRGSSPDDQVNISVDWTFAKTSLGDFNAFVQYSWQDEYFENAVWSAVVNGNPRIYPNLMMDERSIVNARLSIDNVKVGDGHLRFSLWGKNLTDEDFPVYSINFGQLNIITAQYNAPRTWGAELAYEY